MDGRFVPDRLGRWSRLPAHTTRLLTKHLMDPFEPESMTVSGAGCITVSLRRGLRATSIAWVHQIKAHGIRAGVALALQRHCRRRY